MVIQDIKNKEIWKEGEYPFEEVCPICEKELGTNPNCSRCKQHAEAVTCGEYLR